MEVQLGPDLQARLTRLSLESGRDTIALVQEAVERFIDYDEWFLRQVDEGIAAAERGDLMNHAEVGTLIDGRYTG